MRNARGEIPQVAYTDIVDEVASLLVHRANAGDPVKHDGPLCFLVPVQLSNPPWVQTHIHPSHRFGNRQLSDGHLPAPPARLEAHMGHAERKFQVWDSSTVGSGRHENVGI